MAGYVHGYATPEQQRPIEQAGHWRHRLIRDGTTLEPDTQQLDRHRRPSCQYPGASLFGLDIEPQQLAFARTHLERSGVEATLAEGDAIKLPFRTSPSTTFG
jgi:hypothetical protein